jgi:antitoxin VapB
MAIHIRNPAVDSLLSDLVGLTGESKTDAVLNAVKDRLMAVRRQRQPVSVTQQLSEIGARCAQLPTLDDRTDDEILGYDEHGLLP